MTTRSTRARWRRRRRTGAFVGLVSVAIVALLALVAGWPVQATPYLARLTHVDPEFRIDPASTRLPDPAHADHPPANRSMANSGSLRPPAPLLAPLPAPLPAASPPDYACDPRPKADGGTWECTLAEEFDGTSLDRNLWVAQQTATSGFHSGPECLVDSPNNVSVGGGVLRLTVRKEATPFDCSSRKERFTTQYTGGQVSTYDRFSQAYGRFEVRAKFPGQGSRGVQSALWMWPNSPRSDRWEEIDIAEFFSRFGDRAIPFVHYENRTNVTNNDCLIADPGQFHTYAVEWTPQSLTFIYDGRTCLRHVLQPTSYGRAFDGRFIIALSQVLGVTTNSFDPDRTPLPATAEIDYVHVWR